MNFPGREKAFAKAQKCETSGLEELQRVLLEMECGMRGGMKMDWVNSQELQNERCGRSQARSARALSPIWRLELGAFSSLHRGLENSWGKRKKWTLSISGGASLVVQMVKNMPAKQEMRVQSLHWEDPLKKGMATHSSILVGFEHVQMCLLWLRKVADGL